MSGKFAEHKEVCKSPAHFLLQFCWRMDAGVFVETDWVRGFRRNCDVRWRQFDGNDSFPQIKVNISMCCRTSGQTISGSSINILNSPSDCWIQLILTVFLGSPVNVASVVSGFFFKSNIYFAESWKSFFKPWRLGSCSVSPPAAPPQLVFHHNHSAPVRGLNTELWPTSWSFTNFRVILPGWEMMHISQVLSQT